MNKARQIRRKLPVLICLLAMLTGCAHYHPEPLTSKPLLSNDLHQVVNTCAQASSTPLESSDGLDMTELAAIAVLNNPQLQTHRLRLPLAQAGQLQAALLPDPELTTSLEIPSGNDAGLVTGWGVGLAYDLVPLITRQAMITDAEQTRKKVDLQLLWEEWQVMAQAKLLTSRYLLEEERLTLLARCRQLYDKRYEQANQAMANGLVTMGETGANLSALLDCLHQRAELQQSHIQTSFQLHLLLGLQPQVKLPLARLTTPPHLPAEMLRHRLKDIDQRRPDLLALQAGYASQEAKVRAAILRQFPSLTIGVNKARDTGNTDTIGLGVNLHLPLFSANRGQIALTRASRQLLARQYQLRLSQTSSEVERRLALAKNITNQTQELTNYLPALEGLVHTARQAFTHGNIDALHLLNMEYSLIKTRLELSTLTQAQWENTLALAILLALP